MASFPKLPWHLSPNLMASCGSLLPVVRRMNLKASPHTADPERKTKETQEENSQPVDPGGFGGLIPSDCRWAPRGCENHPFWYQETPHVGNIMFGKKFWTKIENIEISKRFGRFWAPIG